MTVLQLDEFKTRQRAVWDSGEYSALSPFIAEVGELVVARARIEPGHEACSTWRAAPATPPVRPRAPGPA